MAAAGTDGPVLEQPVRRLALIGAGVLLLAFLAVRYRSAPMALPDRAFPIPGEPDRLTAEVLNGSGKPGLARTATRVLRRGGVDVMFFGNSTGKPTDSTRLLVRQGDGAAARRAARLLGVGAPVMALDSTRRVDVTVILGADWQPPEEIHP
jgi:hypothetical protein